MTFEDESGSNRRLLLSSNNVDVTVTVLFNGQTQDMESNAISNLQKAVSDSEFEVILGDNLAEELSPQVISDVKVTVIALSPSIEDNSDNDNSSVNTSTIVAISKFCSLLKLGLEKKGRVISSVSDTCE